MESLDIVALIENNPITKLSNVYNNKLLNKIKENFTGFEQQLFLSSFYCYLNYHPTNDFVVELDKIWKWMGFSVKIKAKTILEKHFKINNDYIILLSDSAQQDFQNKKHGGHNKENIMLNITTFKLFCLLSDTKKSKEIHYYFIKLEDLLLGLSLKKTVLKPKLICSTGKKVNKIELTTNQLLGTWNSIVKAAESENISAAKMSRSIKNKVIFNNDYYYQTT